MAARPKFALNNRLALEMAIDEARREADMEGGDVYVCHGPPRCGVDHDRESAPDGGVVSCPFCHRIPLGDPRSSMDVVRDMEMEQ